RTESCNLSNQMEMKSYEECGIETYIFVATLDLRTSSQCRELDGKRFQVSEQQPGANCPPMHPWCRSTTICNVDDNALAKMKRRARNPETGKNETVPADMTYEKWYNQKVKGHPDAELNEKKLQNRRADQKQYEKYKAVYGKDIPDSFDKFQELKYNDIEKWESLKTGKQDKINQMDFSEMDNLKGTLGNKETRLWYKAHDEGIADKIDTTKPIEDQARQAHALRNEYRTQARDLMKDQKERQGLDVSRPNPTFEELVEYKEKKYGLSGDAAYQDIVRSSATTNKKYDQKAGVEEG
ncbi:MAG: minor capsid protein, partial [Hungatella sp.]